MIETKIYLVGTGCGTEDTLTVEGRRAIAGADAVVGAARILDGLRAIVPADNDLEQKIFQAAKPGQICDLLRDFFLLKCVKTVAIALSGDSGFYSGARMLKQKIAERFGEARIEILPGISSVQMLAARLGTPWQDWNLVSAHGISCDPVYEVMKGKPTFFLTGGKCTVSSICSELTEAGLGALKVTVGENLSYGGGCDAAVCGAVGCDSAGHGAAGSDAAGSNAAGSDAAGHDIVGPGSGILQNEGECAPQAESRERVIRSNALQCSQMHFSDLSVLLVDTEADPAEMIDSGREILTAPRNQELKPYYQVQHGGGRTLLTAPRNGIPDAEFVRGKVPMTKMEVRSVLLGKMGIAEGDVVWDIGAGTGSVSVEMAMQARAVWSLERHEEAIGLLHANREKFGRWNMHVVQGNAPEDMDRLPTPDKVFVGGSSGNLREIMRAVWGRNPAAHICISAVLLDTLWEGVQTFEEHGIRPDVVQVAVSRAERVQDKYMMRAGNPVFIISGGGGI